MPSVRLSVVEAVACPPSTPPRCSGPCSAPCSSATGIDPALVGSGGRRLCQPGRRAELQPHPHRLAGRRPAADDGGHHRRHPVRVVAAGDQHGEPRSCCSGVVDIALACGVEVDEPGPDREQLQQEAGARRARSPSRTSRTTSTRRSSRAPSGSPSSGASPATTPMRSASHRSNAPRRAWAEDRFAGQLDPDRGPRSRRRRAARRAPPTSSPATKACARRRSRSSPR